jgi:hypothetical protein
MNPLVLVVGNVGAGKSSFIRECLTRPQFSGFPATSIDDLRLAHGNGRVSGEFMAWSHFLAELETSYGFFEFSGTGKNVDLVRWIVGNRKDIVPAAIRLRSPVHVSLSRVGAKEFNIPRSPTALPLEPTIRSIAHELDRLPGGSSYGAYDFHIDLDSHHNTSEELADLAVEYLLRVGVLHPER